MTRGRAADLLGSAGARAEGLAPLVVAVLLLRPVAASAQSDPGSEGAFVDMGAVPVARAVGRCLDVPRSGPGPGLSDRRVAHDCAVEEAKWLGRAAGRLWLYVLYRHVSVFEPDARTRPDVRSAFPDTVRERELVLLTAAAPAGGRGPRPPEVEPVWHERIETVAEVPAGPRLVHRPEGAYLVLVTCSAGTGGCASFPYRLRAARDWIRVRMPFLEAFRGGLPEGWSMVKGFRLSLDSLEAVGPVNLAGDANCCGTYRARLRLSLRGDTLALAGARFIPDTMDLDRRTLVPGYRAGGLGPGTSEAHLRSWYPAERVRRVDLRLGDGSCTPGDVIEPGSPDAARIAWADSARTRIAFVRIAGRGGRWRTPRGVKVGTPRSRLAELAGGALPDVGAAGAAAPTGGDTRGAATLTWTEPVPAALGEPEGPFELTLGPPPGPGGGDGELEVTAMRQTYAPPAVRRPCAGGR